MSVEAGAVASFSQRKVYIETGADGMVRPHLSRTLNPRSIRKTLFFNGTHTQGRVRRFAVGFECFNDHVPRNKVR